MGRLQIALYWGAACGGCDVSVLDTDAFLLDLAGAADIRFWPIAVDGKYADVEAMADGELDLAIFHGGIRNSENEHVARLLRRKCRTMVAFGACAHLGGIPGLANLTTREEILRRAYQDNPSLEPGSSALPAEATGVNGTTLTLPRLYGRVYRLSEVVEVDTTVPGCPPAPGQVRAVLSAIASGALPPRGSVVGAGERALCDDCRRTKEEKKVRRFVRPWQVIQDPERCLLEQGIVCAGSVTRSGCGARCPESGMPCRGCYGPPPLVADQGAKLVSAIGSMVDSKDPAEIAAVLEGIPDVTGTAYRFSLPASLLPRRT